MCFCEDTTRVLKKQVNLFSPSLLAELGGFKFIAMKRVCIKCGVEKEIEELRKRNDCKSGYSNICKQCYKEYNKKYHSKYYQNNKIKCREAAEEYRRSHPEYRKRRNKLNYLRRKMNPDFILKEKMRSKKRGERGDHAKYRKENKELMASRRKMSYSKNIDKIKIKTKEYRKQLPDYYIVQKIQASTKLNPKTIRLYPDLIKSYRQQIKMKRLLKQKKNESNETS